MTSNSDISGKKVAAGICGILLGAFGIHKFVLGYNTEGLIMLLVSLLTCGTKSDEEFHRTYIASKKGWF
ncbi:TM2 domain-containing protein [Thermosynechococcus sichuanensis E542]|uniref:TM2 domain-containing protein n=1 Tax=Thermosynechococcus sichuanensis E542 TaxID=2016101 RepID=A0A3B7M9W6_9CYAN|nr:TM2 domain-containing protein [Thermosynechococcus vestitus]AXY67407.1 TM2 domain-containing protein [Thermosynechococcus vestitus E542]